MYMDDGAPFYGSPASLVHSAVEVNESIKKELKLSSKRHKAAKRKTPLVGINN